MTSTPAAYCFFQEIAPRPPLDANFERDYLLYAVRGALRLTVGDRRWLLPPSFAAWLPAGTQLRVDIPKPVTSCSVLVEPGLCDSFPARTTVFQMSSLTREMIQHCKDWGADADQPPYAKRFFLSFLDTCAELAAKSVDVTRPSAKDPSLQKAIRFTEENLDKRISAADVARAAHLSERTMQRRFAEQIGAPWAQTLTRIRMIHAIELLADPTLPITQISGDCGYNSLSAFNRAFLAFADTTPTAFRQRLKH